MMPRDLVVFLEQRSRGSAARLAFAAELARRWQAHLVATFVTRPLVMEPHAGFAMGPALVDLLTEHQARLEQELQQARAAFDALAERRSFTAEWRVSDAESNEALMLHARHARVAVLGPPARQQASTTVLGLSEAVILSSGRPSLLLPDDWPADRVARRVVIGWNGGREATRAIADAMPLLADAETVRLVVVPDARTRGLLGPDPGTDMAAHLARHGVRVELEQCPGEDAGRVLLDHCADVRADLLVMGAMARSRLSEALFGGATRTVLSQAQMPVLLST